ncbi:MAG: 1-acyl-sn-glycerol-3-phosphate acyltransferase [Rivularia sp. ALOHA_DT_140]|nr:1-acyl-sn-glycerol-3-phosphate acyltransferase [Rivularia sp. ALOHA_DT_140]
MRRAQAKLNFISPDFNPLILRVVYWLLPIFQRFRLLYWLPSGINKFETVNGENLVNLYHQFQIGKIRLIFAFRHCEVDDPLTGLYLFSREVPRIARQQNITLKSPINCHFMYDRGMTIWAGNWLGWVFSRLGGIPIHRGKSLDLQAIKKTREVLIDGKLPLVVAPEGATNNHSEVISPLEPGVAQLAFWCVDDLAKANRVEQVIVLPINIQYHYIHPQWSKLDWLLNKLEADCGLSKERREINSVKQLEELKQLYLERLFELGEYLLGEMEQFYSHFYHLNLLDLSQDSISREENLTVRLQKLLDVSLEVGEEYFGIQKKGNIIERCRRLEEAGWNYIYREELNKFKIKKITAVKRGLADWIAVEADLRMLHMRLVESFVVMNASYIKEKPCFERFAETALILSLFCHFCERIKSG